MTTQVIFNIDKKLKIQAMKKAQESSRMEPDRAIAELLGAINYLASAVLIIEEQQLKPE